ncbi:aspartate/glutamate racemase family protein [Dethiosulfatarculus sandiegensis]|uniref:Aspartate racemase n=1 Tax=Dethiosulfatarculus sandiegensis TaxID=1429043 RepID=A0A0D2JCI0_9BACT|nr:amino acid racemase [Dethiosulfatarculus sandiegensis]KIX13456.1 hypothetical protein X474_13305 [Dethiosulfatarculus sandiegensis]
MGKKTIGILGGMGPEASADCYAKIIKCTPAAKDQDHLRIVIESNPTVPDRTEAILAGGESPVPVMLKGCRVLEKAGVDFIIIVCNTAHYFLDRLEPELSIPILSILDVVAEAVKQAGLKKVGLLATQGTIDAEIYQSKLFDYGIETLVPDKEHEELVMAAIRSIKAAPTAEQRKEATMRLKDAAKYLLKQGAQGIIGGCTEIPLALTQKDLDVLFFDSQLLLARAAVVRAGLTPLDHT